MAVIEYEGVDITRQVSMTRCVYDAREEGRVPHLIAEFAGGLWDSWNPQPGDRISITSPGAAATGTLYVTDCTPAEGGYELRADALPVPDVPAMREWRKTTFCHVAAQLAATLGLGISFHGVADMPLEYVQQRCEGALPVLARICAMAGCTMDAYDGVLHVCDRAWTLAQDSAGTIDLAAGSEYEYRKRRLYTRCSVHQTPISGIRPGIEAVCGVPGMELAVKMDERVGVGETSALLRCCKGILECVNARRIYGFASANSLSPLSPGSLCSISCASSPSISGAGIITRVRNDYANNTSKFWWR